MIYTAPSAEAALEDALEEIVAAQPLLAQWQTRLQEAW